MGIDLSMPWMWSPSEVVKEGLSKRKRKLFYSREDVLEQEMEFEQAFSEMKIGFKKDKAVAIAEKDKAIQDLAIAKTKADADLANEKAKAVHEKEAALDLQREQNKKAILELTEKVAIAQAKIAEMETQKMNTILTLEKQVAYFTEANKEMNRTLSEIAKEKSRTITQEAGKSNVVVVQDGKQIEIVK